VINRHIIDLITENIVVKKIGMLAQQGKRKLLSLAKEHILLTLADLRRITFPGTKLNGLIWASFVNVVVANGRSQIIIAAAEEITDTFTGTTEETTVRERKRFLAL